MQTWTDCETTILISLGDEAKKRYSGTMVQTALQAALAEYSRFFPGRDAPPSATEMPEQQNEPENPIPAAHAEEICRAAAGIAMRMRAAAVTEVFGRRSEDTASLLRQGDALYSHFQQVMAELSLAEGGGPALPEGPGFPAL